MIQAHVSLGVARIQLLKDKTIVWLQIVFGSILAVYFGKCIIWDKVLELGHTDPLTGDIQLWASAIMAFLFGMNVLDKWTRK